MRKSKLMRVASVLMVAVLASTCFVAGTYAKYVTADSGTDSARVAKFGVVLDVKGSLFGNTYYSSTYDVLPNMPDNDATANITVHSDNSDTLSLV